MKPDMERALGLAHGVQAEYLLMASTAEEKQVKQVFEAMAEDVDRHIKVLRSRQDYIAKWGDQLAQAAQDQSSPSGDEKNAGAQKGGGVQSSSGGNN